MQVPCTPCTEQSTITSGAGAGSARIRQFRHDGITFSPAKPYAFMRVRGYSRSRLKRQFFSSLFISLPFSKKIHLRFFVLWAYAHSIAHRLYCTALRIRLCCLPSDATQYYRLSNVVSYQHPYADQMDSVAHD